jgi:hypothetical protein
LPKDSNPDGASFLDKGLGQVLGKAEENGKFKVPTLRNIALTGPYMHNGYFKTLRGVVDFYNSRDIKPVCANPMTSENDAHRQACWPPAETSANINQYGIGNLRLNANEVDDLVAFLGTLSDGYWQSPALRECLFNWAEGIYADFLSPAGAASQTLAPYVYRYYRNSNVYIGVSSDNNHVYYLGQSGGLQDLVDLSNWTNTAGCP